MSRYLFILVLASLIACNNDDQPYEASPVSEFEHELYSLATLEDSPDKEARIDAFWDSLKVNGHIPYRHDETVIFLYRGEADSVSWNGDFNSWSNDKSFRNTGTQIENTNIWYLKQIFPSDARLDYKITINGSEWILDPNNPHQQWSGFGPNSELRMPDWKPEPLVNRDETIPSGNFSSEKLISSQKLGYDLHYKVYTPAGYDNFRSMPVLYITDGQEYSDERLGAVSIVLDNLIEAQKIEPVIAVFVSPLVPGDLNTNRRADEFATNPDYLNFYVEELIPEIESNYKTSPGAESRAILGTSLGGLNATYFAFTRPDIFGMAAIQSPAYWYREGIFDLVKEYNGKQPALFMSTGTIGDGTEDARTMKQIFDDKNYIYEYIEVPEGHSWGAWRAQIDDLLIHLFGN
jgi:enterochelin esterase family protein